MISENPVFDSVSNFSDDGFDSNLDAYEAAKDLSDSGFVDQGNKGWYDSFTARKIVFPDGQMEICIQREKHFAGPALSAVKKTKRGEVREDETESEAAARHAASMEEAGRRAKKAIRQKCKSIGADRLVTLTFRENLEDRERALKYFDRFRRRMSRCKQFHYVAVMEPQQRGAIHFHIAVRGRQSYNLLRSVWQSVVGLDQLGRQMGQVNVRDPHRFGFGKDGLHRLSSYIAKYVSKQLSIRDLNQKRYLSSRGIVLPEVTTWRVACNNMLGAVETAFYIASEYNLNGLQTWCNNGLGVIWLASAPLGKQVQTNPLAVAPF